MGNYLMESGKEIAKNVTQNGNKSTYIDNHGTVNIYNSAQKGQPLHGSTADMIAVRSFSCQYYQLIVADNSDVFEQNYVIIPTNRALTQNMVPPEILHRCSSLSKKGIAELKTFPALICRKNTGYHCETNSTSYDQMFALGYIHDVFVRNTFIRLDFRTLCIVSKQAICKPDIAHSLGINVGCDLTDLNICGWSVRSKNVFQVLKRLKIDITKGGWK